MQASGGTFGASLCGGLQARSHIAAGGCAQGFEMSDIDSNLLYCHQMQQGIPSSVPLQQQDQHLAHGIAAQNGGHGQPNLPNVKSEGNMDDLLSMFLRVSSNEYSPSVYLLKFGVSSSSFVMMMLGL